MADLNNFVRMSLANQRYKVSIEINHQKLLAAQELLDYQIYIISTDIKSNKLHKIEECLRITV